MTKPLDAVRAENAALLSRYVDAINSWDFATIRLLLHDDISLQLPFAPDGFPRTTQGIEAVMTFLQAVPEFAAEENLYDVTIDTLAGDASELVAHFRSNMKLASGGEYRNRYVLCARIEDGRIIRFAEYFDPIPLVEALGGRIVLPDQRG
jgi:ketosteroid isomerase-like protein